MGNRTRDRVIYIRTDEKLQAEFEKQKEARACLKITSYWSF